MNILIIVIISVILFAFIVAYITRKPPIETQQERQKRLEKEKRIMEEKKKKTEILNSYKKKYGEDLVKKALEKKIDIDMGKDLILSYIGEPGDIRNQTETADKMTEEWHYLPKMDNTGKLLVDGAGEIIYDLIVTLENDIVTIINRP